MPDRRVDHETRNRVSALHIAYVRFARRTYVSLIILFLALVFGLAAFGYTLHQVRQANARTRELTQENKARATNARELAQAIQRQRQESCVRGNVQNAALRELWLSLDGIDKAKVQEALPTRDCGRIAPIPTPDPIATATPK